MFLNNRIKVFLIALSFTTNSFASVEEQSANKPTMAIGNINSEQLLSTYTDFSQEFEAFSVSEAEMKQVAAWPNTVTIDVFFGSWCHDSVREVPRLLKAVNKQVKVNLIGLDYLKSEPLGRALQAEIKFTPTFIVYLNNKELGRIVERPTGSLVTDIDNLIKTAS